jgi:hypothetical protein
MCVKSNGSYKIEYTFCSRLDTNCTQLSKVLSRITRKSVYSILMDILESSGDRKSLSKKARKVMEYQNLETLQSLFYWSMTRREVSLRQWGHFIFHSVFQSTPLCEGRLLCCTLVGNPDCFNSRVSEVFYIMGDSATPVQAPSLHPFRTQQFCLA